MEHMAYAGRGVHSALTCTIHRDRPTSGVWVRLGYGLIYMQGHIPHEHNQAHYYYYSISSLFQSYAV